MQTSSARLDDGLIWPDVNVKVACALLPISIQRGDTDHGEAWVNAAQTGGVRVFGGMTWSKTGAGVHECVRVPRKRAAAPSVNFVRLLRTQTFTCVSLSCRAPLTPARLARSGTCWSGTPSPAPSAAWCWSWSSGGPVDGVTVRVHAADAVKPTGQARSGWRQGTRTEDQWEDPEKMHKILQKN